MPWHSLAVFAMHEIMDPIRRMIHNPRTANGEHQRASPDSANRYYSIPL